MREEIRESFDGWSQVEAKKVRLAHVFAKQAVAELLKIDIVQDATSCGIEQSLDAWESEVRDMTHSVANAKPSSDAKKDEHLEFLELENFTFLISTEINRYSEHRFQSKTRFFCLTHDISIFMHGTRLRAKEHFLLLCL
mgnify:CR=1 FL=1